MSPCTVGKVYARRMIPKMRYCGAEVLLNDMRVVFESFAMWLVVRVKGEFLDEAAKTYNTKGRKLRQRNSQFPLLFISSISAIIEFYVAKVRINFVVGTS